VVGIVYTETGEANALYLYAQTADVMQADVPMIDDSYTNVDCKFVCKQVKMSLGHVPTFMRPSVRPACSCCEP